MKKIIKLLLCLCLGVLCPTMKIKANTSETNTIEPRLIAVKINDYNEHTFTVKDGYAVVRVTLTGTATRTISNTLQSINIEISGKHSDGEFYYATNIFTTINSKTVSGNKLTVKYTVTCTVNGEKFTATGIF